MQLLTSQLKNKIALWAAFIICITCMRWLCLHVCVCACVSGSVFVFQFMRRQKLSILIFILRDAAPTAASRVGQKKCMANTPPLQGLIRSRLDSSKPCPGLGLSWVNQTVASLACWLFKWFQISFSKWLHTQNAAAAAFAKGRGHARVVGSSLRPQLYF